MSNGADEGDKFEGIAREISQRVSELISAPVLVTDERGIVIAGSEPDVLRLPYDVVGAARDIDYARVPLSIDGRAGEVFIGEPIGENISPRLAQVMLELVINQTTVIDRLPNRHELKNKFIYDLLQGKVEDEASAFQQARFLGLDLAPPRALILIDASDFIMSQERMRRNEVDDARVQRLSQIIISGVVSFFHLPNDTICAYIGNGEVAVLKASNTRNLSTWVEAGETSQEINSSWANLAALKRASQALLGRLQNDTSATINIGVGRYHPGISGLAYSFQDARIALSLGRRFNGQKRVHCLDELGIAAFVGVSDERTKIDLAVHLLSPLDHEPHMLETLEVFFDENGSPSATAERLSIHRNTLSYRLDKIASLTGLDPRRFDDAVQIRLALLLRSLRVEAQEA